MLFDRAGMLLSCLCVVHCAVIPFVLAYLPVLGLDWLVDERVHGLMTVGAIVLAGSSFLLGFLRHGFLLVPILGATGLGLLFWSASSTEAACSCCRLAPAATSSATSWLESMRDGWQMPLGGVLLVMAHAVNGRCCRKCRRRSSLSTVEFSTQEPKSGTVTNAEDT